MNDPKKYIVLSHESNPNFVEEDFVLGRDAVQELINNGVLLTGDLIYEFAVLKKYVVSKMETIRLVDVDTKDAANEIL